MAMKVRLFFFSALSLVLVSTSNQIRAQCPKISFIYADACEAPDGKGEFLILRNAEEPLPVNGLSINLPDGTTLCKTCANAWTKPNVSNLNLLAGCGSLFIPVGPGDSIPAGAMTVIFSNRNFKDDVNWSNFCGEGPIYVLTIDKVNNNNKYPHNDGLCGGTAFVTANFSGISSCASYTVSYEPCSMAPEIPAGSGGGPALIFDEYGAVLYIDVGCDNFMVEAVTLPANTPGHTSLIAHKSETIFMDNENRLVISGRPVSEEWLTIEISELRGRTILRTKVLTQNGSAILPLGSLNSGVFFAIISDKYGKFTSHKFIRLIE